MKIPSIIAVMFSVALTLTSCGDDQPQGATTKVTTAEAQVLRPLKSLEEARLALDTWKQNRSTRAALDKAMKDHPEWADQLVEGKLDNTAGDAGKYIPLHPALTKEALDNNISLVAYMVTYAEAHNGDYTELNKLLAKKPDVNAYPPENSYGPSCLSVGSQVESLRILIKAGLDVNKPVLPGERTILQIAREVKNLPKVQALLDAGARE